MTLSKTRLVVATVIAGVSFGSGQSARAQVTIERPVSPATARPVPVLVKFHPQISGAAGGAGATGATGAGTTGSTQALGAAAAAAMPGAASGQPSPAPSQSPGTTQIGGAGVIGGAAGLEGVAGVEQNGDLPPAGTGRLTPLMMQGVRDPIGAANISVEMIGTQVVPEDQAAKQAFGVMPLPGGQERGIGYVTYRWQATNICHWPLYFEEPMLERHGQQRCPTIIQPAVSGAKFLTNVALLPYKATLWPACESRYTLGHFRPGSPAPLLRDTLPWSPRAALVQGAAVTGVAVGLPW